MKYQTMALALCLLLSGCSMIGSSTNIETEKGAEKLKNVLIEKLSGDMMVGKVSLNSQESLNTSMDMLQVYEIGDKEEVPLHTVFTGISGKKTDETFHNFFKSGDGIKLKDLPEKLIFQNAKAVMAAVPEDLEYSSISSYEQQFPAGKPGPASIVVHAMPKSGATKLRGKKLTINYYELNFTVDTNGKVTLEKE